MKTQTDINEVKLDGSDPQQQEITRDKKGRFIKGLSGNPGGTPVGTISLQARLRKRLIEHPEKADAIADGLIALAIGRELGAIKEAFDRIDGKATETHRIEGELPIKLIFVPVAQLENVNPALKLKASDKQDEDLYGL